MAKRFIDTELFDDSWFMDLAPDYKLFYIYLITNCDHAGIIDLNIRLAEFKTGIKELSKSFQTVMELFGKKRIIHLTDNYYFLPKFIKYQYPNGLSISVKAQKSVRERLDSFNLYNNSFQTVNEQLGNSLITVQDKDIYKDKDKDKDILKGGMGGNLKDPINDLMEYYGFNEIRNPDKLKQAYLFIKILDNDNKLDFYLEQFAAYKKYKETSKEIKHSFSGFIGTIEERFLDGGWNSRNWVKELEQPNNNNAKLMVVSGILKD